MKIRVLVVDDSAFMRKLITDFLQEEPKIEVIATAKNGQEALEKIKLLNPDVVTLDIEMPVMNGLDCLRELMKTMPKPVIMLSNSTKEGAEHTFKAMQLGAIDFIAKPSGTISLDLYKVKEEVIAKVLLASKANLNPIKKRTIKLPSSAIINDQMKELVKEPAIAIHTSTITKSITQLVCIGTSTGGPHALQEVLTRIPKTIDAPILVVQHMPPGFTKSLAVRLDQLSEITVKEAENGDILQKGVAYIAKGAYHLKVKRDTKGLVIVLDQTPLVNGHRPAVDVMFESVAELKEYKKVAVVMTGMGADGAKGLVKMKENGNVFAIAESEETSVVFGMPKAAIATNLVDEVAPLEKISDAIMKFMNY